jgi:polar amino acid transport system substrate-binding protein
MRHKLQVSLPLSLLFAFACTPALADEPFILFAAPTNSSMPTAEFRDNVLEAGILKDLGQAIGDELHRETRFVALPRKRIEQALVSGDVDGVCNVRPEWLEVPLHWSIALIPDQSLLVSNPAVAAPGSLAEVSGKTLGLVLGYKYPELKAAVGNNYRRDDAPNAPLNIEKLLLGRESYAIVDKLDFDYQSKLHPQLRNFSRLPISNFSLRCGFSKTARIPLNEIDRAIQKLVNSGKLAHLLDPYRQ